MGPARSPDPSARPPPPRQPPRGGPRLAPAGRRGSRAGFGQRRPAAAAAAAAAQLRAPGARGSRRVSEAAAAEAAERSRRQRGRPPRLPAPTVLSPASAPVTFPGRLPRPRAPSPEPQAGARPFLAPPSRGAAGGQRRPWGRWRRGWLQPPPPPAAALGARPDCFCPAAAREPGLLKLGARPRSPRRARSGQALP